MTERKTIAELLERMGDPAFGYSSTEVRCIVLLRDAVSELLRRERERERLTLVHRYIAAVAACLYCSDDEPLRLAQRLASELGYPAVEFGQPPEDCMRPAVEELSR